MTFFSLLVSKGVGACMLKVGSKRRRTKNEIEEEKQMEEARKVQMVADMQELAALRNRVQEAEYRADNNAGAA